MKKGEIWRVRLPFGGGHTQAGERPALIVQEDSFNVTLPTVLVVPFTSTLGPTGLPARLSYNRMVKTV